MSEPVFRRLAAAEVLVSRVAEFVRKTTGKSSAVDGWATREAAACAVSEARHFLVVCLAAAEGAEGRSDQIELGMIRDLLDQLQGLVRQMAEPGQSSIWLR